MDETFCRIALLTGLVVFTLLAVVLPVIRHRIRHGSGTGFVLAQVTDPVGKVVGVAITTNTNLVGLFGFVFFFFGPGPVRSGRGSPRPSPTSASRAWSRRPP